MIDHTEISAGINTLEGLRLSLNHIIELNNNRFNENDIRYYFINQLNRAIFCNTLNLSYFERTIRDKNHLDQILWTPTSRDHFEVMDSYINNVRLSMIINLSTITERFMRRVLEAVENKNDNGDAIWKKRARIFEILKIDSNSEISKAHEILFHMRNTIHNNGIYTGKNDINYDYTFQIHYFKKGFVHNSANFRTLSFIVRDLIAFYSLVVEDDEIKKIDYIPEVLKISF
ncbi:hypothetical protein [Chryseobacterium sp. 5_R23647]|uniref:hypothetical protein n=1 Tax=Chryseobacterium sp. 5_R23647 TaxID=2258964 RepID=UPI000E225235|nr:hypothetical protein [Chryseobacterium sp. 5_R23647]REC45182.1 hypothetical protein DRF69_04750 [Chryseobacterium sp. 5_R23647]